MDDLIPSPVANMDMRTYRMTIARAMANPDDPGIPAVFIRWANQSSSNDKETKKQKSYELFLQLALEEHLRHIDRLIDEYWREAEWHRQQMVLEQEKMQTSLHKISELNEFIDDADRILDKNLRNQPFDRQKTLDLLHERGVLVPDNADESVLLTLLQKEKAKALQERAQESESYDRAKSAHDYHERMEQENIRKAKDLERERERIINSDLSPEEQERKLKDLIGKYDIDVAQQIAERSPSVLEKRIEKSQTSDQERAFINNALALSKPAA